MSKAQTLGFTELISRNACDHVYDTKDLCNKEVVYLFCNTWLGVCLAHSKACFELVYNQLIDKGLVQTIDWCKEIADNILNEDGHIPVTSLQDLDLEGALECLLFGSRLTLNVDGAGYEDVIDLLRVNTRMKLLDRTYCGIEDEYHPSWCYFSNDIREMIHIILCGYKPLDRVYDPYNPILTNGAASDASKLKAHKLMRCEAQLTPPWVPFVPTDELRTVTPTTVPKNYKRRRVIAPESVSSQEKMGVIDDELRRIITKHCTGKRGLPLIVFDDQENNRNVAIDSSQSGRYATIDLTHASDTFRVSSLSLFPKKVRNDILKVRSTIINVRGSERLSYIVSTAGSRLTFPLETLWFAVIAQVAVNYASLWLGKKLPPAQAYGDDLVVPTESIDLVLYLLDIFGHTVNDGKSFLSGPIREACGALGYKGISIQNSLWPRHDYTYDWNSKEGKWLATGIGSIIDLQHRFYHYFDVRMFLTSYIKSVSPKMTSHSPFVDCDDLWSEVPHFNVVAAPMDQDAIPTDIKIDDPWYREEHFELVTRYKKVKCCDKPCCAGKTVQQLKENYEMYIYSQYLQHGPMYANDLDELLGVTTSRVNRSDLAQPYKVWKLVSR